MKNEWGIRQNKNVLKWSNKDQTTHVGQTRNTPILGVTDSIFGNQNRWPVADICQAVLKIFIFKYVIIPDYVIWNLVLETGPFNPSSADNPGGFTPSLKVIHMFGWKFFKGNFFMLNSMNLIKWIAGQVFQHLMKFQHLII